MIKDKYLLKKINVHRVLSKVQFVSTLLVVTTVIMLLVIKDESYFKGTFALVYSIVLAFISALTIVVTLIKSKLEANMIECMDKNVHKESREIFNILTGKK